MQPETIAWTHKNKRTRGKRGKQLFRIREPHSLDISELGAA